MLDRVRDGLADYIRKNRIEIVFEGYALHYFSGEGGSALFSRSLSGTHLPSRRTRRDELSAPAQRTSRAHPMITHDDST